MRVEVTIDKTKQLPVGAVEAFRAEFEKRLTRDYPDATLSVRRAGNDGMTLTGGSTHDREVIDMMLQETWESADDWFQP